MGYTTKVLNACWNKISQNDILIKRLFWKCNFRMGTIFGKGFTQALVHPIYNTCTYAKPFPIIVSMRKVDISELKGPNVREWITIFFKYLIANMHILIFKIFARNSVMPASHYWWGFLQFQQTNISSKLLIDSYN